MPPKMATFVWEKSGSHLGRLPAKSEPCISEKSGLFLDSAHFFHKLLEKRKSFFSKFKKKIGWTSHFPLVSHFGLRPLPPPPFSFFFPPQSLALSTGFRFAEIQSIPSFSAIFGMSFPFLSPLSFPILSYWPAFPLGRRRTPLPHSQLFSKNLKKSICAFHRV